MLWDFPSKAQAVSKELGYYFYAPNTQYQLSRTVRALVEVSCGVQVQGSDKDRSKDRAQRERERERERGSERQRDSERERERQRDRERKTEKEGGECEGV